MHSPLFFSHTVDMICHPFRHGQDSDLFISAGADLMKMLHCGADLTRVIGHGFHKFQEFETKGY